MASERGPVATEAPPFSSPASQSSPPAPVPFSATLSVETIAAEAARATQSLKRQREATPTSPSSVLPPTFGSDLSPTKAARIAGLAARRSPAPMTGAAALEDERRRNEEEYRLQVSGASENPAYRAQTALMSANALGLSRPQDAPPPYTEPEQLPNAPPAASASIPSMTETDAKTDVGPETATTMPGLESVGAPAVTSVDTSPRSMDIDAPDGQQTFGAQPEAQMEERGVTSLSYPGILPPNTNMPAPPNRGMSLPMTPNAQAAPRSPSSKKHKCPHCETEFTRHHNLKSHLLTHSQEKPYVCQNCSMRFRRLHDLKRHSKLHTGEKPHVCPKCDRKFARGDALARHSKGPGGCVGRRSSMGSYLGEEDPDGVSRLEGDDSTMSGVMYDGSMNEADMTDEDRQRLSGLPSIKAQHIEGNQIAPTHHTARLLTEYISGANQGRLFPPNPEHGSTSSNTSQVPGGNISALPLGGGNSTSMYSQTGMTESPKPLSPGLQAHDPSLHRQRSPSLTSQFQQQHFVRQPSDRQTPPVPGFSAAEAAKYAASAVSGQGTASQPGSGSSLHQPMVGSSGTGHARNTSIPEQNGGSGDSTSNNLFASEAGIWTYITELEGRVRSLTDRVQHLEASEKLQEDRIMHLASEVATLRAQTEGNMVEKVNEPPA
ncbi:hypothetical protein GGR57DRAFT_457337 [Xylariaceae sp. FL1272]|nr:hypothetical protein GGR57DRAFT_457337 [Xylariaceae sp. FL1272]